MNAIIEALVNKAHYDWNDEVFNEIMNEIFSKIGELKDESERHMREDAYNVLDKLEVWLKNGNTSPKSIEDETWEALGDDLDQLEEGRQRDWELSMDQGFGPFGHDI